MNHTDVRLYAMSVRIDPLSHAGVVKQRQLQERLAQLQAPEIKLELKPIPLVPSWRQPWTPASQPDM